MKKIYLLLLISASTVNSNIVSATNPSDTLRESKYSLSSRNAEALSGKYKKLDLALTLDSKTKIYTLDLIAEREINAYIEITDQEENVIYFRQLEIKEGKNQLTFVGEDGVQTLFRLSFSEPSAIKPAVFIIREDE